jgi:hypothetical protein
MYIFCLFLWNLNMPYVSLRVLHIVMQTVGIRIYAAKQNVIDALVSHL